MLPPPLWLPSRLSPRVLTILVALAWPGVAHALNVALAPPQISEFLADNAGNFSDEDGASPD